MVGTVGMAVTAAVTANEVRMARKQVPCKAAPGTPSQADINTERLNWK